MPGQPATLTSIALALAGLILTFTAVQAQAPSDAEAAQALNSASAATNRGGRERPPARADQFVRRNGSMLLLDGREFRFAGANVYYLEPEIVYNNIAGVRQALDKAVELGLTVIRAHGFNDHPPSNGDPAVIQTSPGVFVEANLVALDQAVAEAKERNLRLIFNLTNNWTAYGGIDRYIEWKLGHVPNETEHAMFYTDEEIKSWYKGYVSMLLNRVNTVTGVAYKDEPAIMAWELANELRNRSGGADALLAWHAEMAAYIKSIDRNHLVADGGEGFDDRPDLYAGISNTYPVSGFEGCSYSRLVNIPEIDLVSYHLYPSFWGLNDESDVEIYIRVHQQLARAAGKVAYMGEFGKRAAGDPPNCDRTIGRQYDAERALIFDRWLKNAMQESGTSGQMFWQLVYDERTDCDGFAVYVPEDAGSVSILQAQSAIMNRTAPAAVSAASYVGQVVATDSLASLFGLFGANLATGTEAATAPELPTVLAGTSVLVKDALGVERPAMLSFVSPERINFHVPPGTAVGGAVVTVMQNDQFVAYGTVNIAATRPGLFSADGSGSGLAAATVLRIRANGRRSYEPVARYDPRRRRFVAVPIDLGRRSDQVFLILSGTGIRNRDSLSAVTVRIDGEEVDLLSAEAQGSFPGLDEVKVRLPHRLDGRGRAAIYLKLAGDRSNRVEVSFR